VEKTYEEIKAAQKARPKKKYKGDLIEIEIIPIASAKLD